MATYLGSQAPFAQRVLCASHQSPVSWGEGDDFNRQLRGTEMYVQAGLARMCWHPPSCHCGWLCGCTGVQFHEWPGCTPPLEHTRGPGTDHLPRQPPSHRRFQATCLDHLTKTPANRAIQRKLTSPVRSGSLVLTKPVSSHLFAFGKLPWLAHSHQAGRDRIFGASGSALALTLGMGL